MSASDTSFHVEVPLSLKPWATYQADMIGLPSPENYILLLVRRAWQDHYLAAILQACKSGESAE